VFFQTDQLQHLLDNLQAKGYTCIAPQVRHESIIYDEITSVEQLPQGINDQQQPGSYTLTTNNGSKYFNWANGPQAMIDPPREEAIQAVRACQTAGIRVKMITGDHAITAAAIASQIGLDDDLSQDSNDGTLPQVLQGRELEVMSDAELIIAATSTAVFARVTPEQKLRLRREVARQ